MDSQYLFMIVVVMPIRTPILIIIQALEKKTVSWFIVHCKIGPGTEKKQDIRF